MRTYGFGRGKWVFVDWLGIDPGFGMRECGVCAPRGIELAVHRPRVHPEWVLAPDKPWEKLGIHAYSSFLAHDGKFHCWYETHWQKASIPTDNGIGHAVSDDGVNWEKPALGVREVLGSRDNNLIDISGHGACVCFDPVAVDGAPFKTLMQHNVPPVANKRVAGKKWWRQVGGAVSKDGFRWTVLDEAVLPDNHPDTQNVLTYDPYRGRYVIFTRQHDGRMQRRGVNRSKSETFGNFPCSRPVIESRPQDPPDWDIYCPGYHLWPGCPNAHVMLMSTYRHGTDTVCVHLMTSRDGEIWHRPADGAALIDTGDVPLDGAIEQVYACHGILDTGPDEWSIYVKPCFEGHNAPREGRVPTGILRATLRKDGFVSLRSVGEGEFWTVPFKLRGGPIRLNIKTRRSGSVRCGVLGDAYGETGHAGNAGAFVPGFSPTDCVPVEGDHVAAELRWQGGSLERMKGQVVRLAFQLSQADLYAIDFGPEQ